MKAVSDNVKTVGGDKMLKFLDHIPKELKVSYVPLNSLVIEVYAIIIWF